MNGISKGDKLFIFKEKLYKDNKHKSMSKNDKNSSSHMIRESSLVNETSSKCGTSISQINQNLSKDGTKYEQNLIEIMKTKLKCVVPFNSIISVQDNVYKYLSVEVQNENTKKSYIYPFPFHDGTKMCIDNKEYTYYSNKSKNSKILMKKEDPKSIELGLNSNKEFVDEVTTIKVTENNHEVDGLLYAKERIPFKDFQCDLMYSSKETDAIPQEATLLIEIKQNKKPDQMLTQMMNNIDVFSKISEEFTNVWYVGLVNDKFAFENDAQKVAKKILDQFPQWTIVLFQIKEKEAFGEDLNFLFNPFIYLQTQILNNQIETKDKLNQIDDKLNQINDKLDQIYDKLNQMDPNVFLSKKKKRDPSK